MTKQNLLGIKQKIEDLHYTSYDGSLIQIIDEFKQKFRKQENFCIDSYMKVFIFLNYR